MKILMIMDSPVVPTGYGSTARLTARELAERGHEVFALAFNGGPQEGHAGERPFMYGQIKVWPNYARLERSPDNLYGDPETIIRVCREANPDILLWHNDSYRFSYLKDLPQDILAKSVFWLPYEGTTPDPLGPSVFCKCAAVRFVTKHAMDANAPLLAGIDAGVIPHAVDMKHLKPSLDKRDAKIRKGPCGTPDGLADRFVVARVDRNQPRKYWDLTIKAFARFAEGKDDVFLLCKCNPNDAVRPEGPRLDQLAETSKLRGKIMFDDYFFDVSYMPMAFYHPADVFLTTTSSEGFGLTPVEAMACGVPVVYPATPVLPEVVGAEYGYECALAGSEWYEPLKLMHNLVDLDDVVAKLEACYRDWKAGGAALKAMGEKCARKALETYSPKVVYDAWDAVLRKVSEKRQLVSIITVLYNVSGDDQLTGEDGVDRLRLTMEQHVKHPYEWIIVDNGSPHREKTREWMKAAAERNPRIRRIHLDVNLGFAAAHNVAIKEATGSYVMLVNPDSEAVPPAKHGLTKDFVRIMADRVDSDPAIGIVGMSLMQRDDILTGCEFPYFCCVMISRACLKAVEMSPGKWFDERFWPAYYEDLDLCVRAVGKGFKLFEQDIPFWHKSGGTNKYAIDSEEVKDKIPKGKVSEYLMGALHSIDAQKLLDIDVGRKTGEIATKGMQGLIAGNIALVNSKWGLAARSKIRVVFHVHIGAGVGFSQIAEGLAPELHKLGFDVYVNDWSNGGHVEDPVIAQLVEKARKAKESGDDLRSAIHICCWLMENFLDVPVDAEYKVGVAFLESTKLRHSYLHLCNGMDRILTFSEFCRRHQKESGVTVPIDVITPGVNRTYLNPSPEPANRNKFTFMAVGVHQNRKDTRRLVEAFCEEFALHLKGPESIGDAAFPLQNKDIELVIKSNNFGGLKWVSEMGFDKRANVRCIFTGWAKDQGAQRPDLSTYEMYDLYAGADCLVHPSHGEGIGMPIFEAAAVGKPAIFTNWSTPSEYFDENNSYPCSLSEYPGTKFTRAYPECGNDENGVWANIHIGHMKHLMMQVVRDRDETIAKGRAAAAHVAKNFTWQKSARKLMPLLFEWEAQRLAKKKSAPKEFHPLTFQKPNLEPVRPGERVMVDIVTRDRQQYVASLLTSLLSQTFKDWDVTLQIDDSDESVLNNHQILGLLGRIQHDGHGWRMLRSQQAGPHMAHQRTLTVTTENPGHKYKLICRIDDDLIVRPDFLEKLFGQFAADEKCELGAISGVYLDPRRPEDRGDNNQMVPPGWETDINYAGKVDHNTPWPFVSKYPPGTKPRQVEHLHCSFMYRTEIANAIGGYCKLFSQVGHREETDFSYRFFLAGYKVMIHPEAVAFHFSAPRGGIRSESIIDKNALAESDHKIFMSRLASWRRPLPSDEQARPAPAPVVQPPPEKRGKIVAVVNGSTRLDEAVGRFSEISDEVYATLFGATEAEKQSLAEKHPKLKMVATTGLEVAVLTKAILSEGDHEYIMSVTDSMRFLEDPLPLLSKDYDDYVFETYKTYIPGRWNGLLYVGDESIGTVIGPELANKCLITRRRPNAKASMDRTLYSDIFVLDDVRMAPMDGKSVLGNELIPLSEVNSRSWTKYCTYQFPKGSLKVAEEREVAAAPANMVSIIIPTPGRKMLLKKCIDSIYAHTSTPFEVIVVDNASTDGTVEMLAEQQKLRGNITVLKMPVNVGYQKAINIGRTKARGKYVLLFNDDAWVLSKEPDGRDWLRAMIDELDHNPKVGIVGPQGCDSPALRERILYFWCVMLRRETLDKVGPLDDVTFRNYGGDDDYCRRLRNAGYEIREKSLQLGHLMNVIPDAVKKPELAESRLKLQSKYGVK